MKHLTRIEKSRSFWFLLSTSLYFFLLRLPSLIEPYWYGDEGIYQVLGIAIRKGNLLYAQIWDNKPPLLYMLYALFNGDQFQVRLFSLIVGVGSVIAIFLLSRLIFSKMKALIISTTFFAFIFATPLLEGNIANAENFILLPVIAAGFLIYHTQVKNTNLSDRYLILNNKHLTLFAAGILLGIGFLLKIVAVFDFLAFASFLLIASWTDKNSLFSSLKSNLTRFLKTNFLFFVGFITPLVLTLFYYLTQNALQEFVQAAFFSNIGYVGWGNQFLIPQGFLILKSVLLLGALVWIFSYRKKLNTSSLFILLWIPFSFFSTYFSGRPYTHYALLAIPPLSLLLGLLFDLKDGGRKFFVLVIFVLCSFILINTFNPNYKKSLRYYENFVSFITNKKDINSYWEFFDKKTPRNYKVASFIKSHTAVTDNVFIWGDSAQIYALSGKLPPGKYTVAYHIRQYPKGVEETQDAIEKSKPKYIISLHDAPELPFSLVNYTSKLMLDEAIIYERAF